MNRVSFIALWGLTVFLGFAIGMAIGGSKEPRVQPRYPRQATAEQAEPDHALLASLQRFQGALAEKENLAASLRAEIEEARGKLLPPLTPDDEEWLAQELKEQKVSGRYARSSAVRDKVRELEQRILQRKDKALRAKTLDEVASLLKGEDANDVLLGLAVLTNIFREGIEFDKERFKPLVLAALDHEEREVRSEAFEYVRYLGWAGEREMAADVALRMMGDPEFEVRADALWYFDELGDREKHEEVAATLKALLKEEDKESRSVALGAIRSLADERTYPVFHQDGPVELVTRKGCDYYDELKEVVMEASKDPESAQDVLKFWWQRETLSREEVERAAEILASLNPDEYYEFRPDSSPACSELRDAAYRYHFRVIRESALRWGRSNAVQSLERTQDTSLLPELKALAVSEDAEGIERELQNAIEHLERRAKEQR
jgi:hypothetical protein